MANLVVDINCDLGEDCGNDAELMKYISSANIACGFHAGDKETMRRTVDLALEHGVAVGAHPGYNDREGFGRVSIDLSHSELIGLVTVQVSSLGEICKSAGVRMKHVKPHGALYNQAAKDVGIAEAIAEAVKTIDPELILFGLSGSCSITEAQRLGLRTVAEAFADRTYTADGTLTPRTEPNALITDTEESLAQVIRMIREGIVISTTGETVPIAAETICIHGDGAHAVEFAIRIDRALTENGINIVSP